MNGRPSDFNVDTVMRMSSLQGKLCAAAAIRALQRSSYGIQRPDQCVSLIRSCRAACNYGRDGVSKNLTSR